MSTQTSDSESTVVRITDLAISTSSSSNRVSIGKNGIDGIIHSPTTISLANSASSQSPKGSPLLLRTKAAKRPEKQEFELQRKASMLIDEGLREDKRKMEEYRKEPKILILGSSDSGKSTLLKQFKILHCHGFTSDEKAIAKYQIYKNLIVAAITLVALADCDACDSTNDINQSFVSDMIGSFTSSSQLGDASPLQLQDEASIQLDINSPLVKKYHALMVYGEKNLKTTITKIPQDIRELIQLIFQEEGIFTTLKKGYSHHKLPDSTTYFVDQKKLPIILNDDDYIPSNEDILFLRTATQAVSKTTFKAKESSNRPIHIFDVSGLKGHRKAWLPYFDDCNSVLYMVSLSSIDMTMLEDPSVNRMLDSLFLFEQTTINPMLQKCDFILFLNKKDLFADKVPSFKLNSLFPEYQGPNHNVVEYTKFIRSKFQKSFKSKRDLIIHVTCATSTSAISVIISSVVNSLVANTLRDGGLL